MGQPIPLLGGFYKSRGIITAAQECINLYPEPNPKGLDFPEICYPTPGMTLRVSGENTNVAEVRGLYFSNRKQLFAAIGNELHFIDSTFNNVFLGNLNTFVGPVSMKDNGFELLAADGTDTGYVQDLTDLTTGGFSTVGTGDNYRAADIVDVVNGYFVLNEKGTNRFFTSNLNAVTFNPLFEGTKTGTPDNINGLKIINRQIWLLGELRGTEIWAGIEEAPLLPFEIFPGGFFDNKCSAIHCPAKGEKEIFWLGGIENGGYGLFRGIAYETQEIDTYAVSNEIELYTTINDAIGYVYEQQKHKFYVLTFPTADVTWVYDATTGYWHRRGWLDSNGILHRHRSNCCAAAYNKILVGDFENGNIYSFELDNMTDNDDEIKRVRAFQHITGGSKFIEHNQFYVDMLAGNEKSGGGESKIFLRVSDTDGRTWSNPIERSIGSVGQYLYQPSWTTLGSAFRKTFEISWTDPVFTCIQGGWLVAQGGTKP